jgi:cellulose biosynthesis protein BcsQ
MIMQDLSNQEKKNPTYISFCTQKGGAGKSVFTTLAASYLHYEKGYNVAVIDCDYPQWSIQKMRHREAEQIKKNTYYWKKASALFQKLNKPTYPVVPTQPEKALADAAKFLKNEERQYDLVLFDLPGTVNNQSVVEIYFNMDYLFVPLTISRINMESTLYFIVTVNDILAKNPGIRLKSVQTFWNRITEKEKQELSDMYNRALAELNVSVMQTRIPQSVKYDREQSISGNDYLFLSTVFPPDKPLLKGSNWDVFMDEFLNLTNIQQYGNNSNRKEDI